jgi:hypothetical protein
MYTRLYLQNQTRETDTVVLEDEITKMNITDTALAFKNMRYGARSKTVGCFNRPPVARHFIPLQKVWDGRWPRGMGNGRKELLDKLRSMLNQKNGLSPLQDAFFMKCEFIATEALIRRVLQKNTRALWETLMSLSEGPRSPAGWSVEMLWYNMFVEQLQ